MKKIFVRIKFVSFIQPFAGSLRIPVGHLIIGSARKTFGMLRHTLSAV